MQSLHILYYATTRTRLTLPHMIFSLPLDLGIRDTWLRLTPSGHANVGRAAVSRTNIMAPYELYNDCISIKNNYANVYIRGKGDRIIEFQISAFPLRHSTKMSKLKFLGHYYLINLILQFY